MVHGATAKAGTNATPDQVPDWIEVEFAGSKTIDEIDVFSLHDDAYVQNTPTETQTFTLYGLLAFDVQYWNGSSWVTVPGGSVSGNNKVWRKFTFSAITTSKIRVWINQVPDSWSRVVEIQAFGVSSSGEKVQWLVPDHLGTPRMIVDQTGTLASVKRHDYLPFGEELFAPTGGRTAAQGYTSGDSIRQQFTSKERDVETGLDYFGARYYASMQGRFSSFDPGTFTPADPQNWNRYSYVENDPLKFIDPDGKDLFLTGADADYLVSELEKQTGYKLNRDAKTGRVTIDTSVKRNMKSTSTRLANKILEITGDREAWVQIKTGRNQPEFAGDSYADREIDVADYNAFKKGDPKFAARFLAHVLEEYYHAEKMPIPLTDEARFPESHKAALEFESQVLSDFTGSWEKLREQKTIREKHNVTTVRFEYSTVAFDVTYKSVAGGDIQVTKVSKIERRKP